MTAPAPSLACLTTSAELGGAETSLLTLLTALRALDRPPRITVVTPGPGPLAERCRALGFGVLELPFPAALNDFGESGATTRRRSGVSRAGLLLQGCRTAAALPGYLRSLRAVLQRTGATVIHSNGLKAHVAAALIKPRGTRLVWHLHEYVRGRPLSAALLRLLASRADVIVANSDSVRRDAATVIGRRASLRYIHNAVDPGVFSPDGPPLDLAALSGLPPDLGLVRIGLVSTFARWKGHHVFLDAIARLRPRHPIRAYVIGGAVYATAGSQWSPDELRTLAAARGLSDTVGFTGHVDNVPAALRSLDIVVHASTEPEPFGMAIAEGMAARRAVVAARAGGAAELFDDRVSAVGYTPGDAVELADRLEELVVDAARRDVIAATARSTAIDRFSPERMARAFREVYAG
jgi:glycosyltransferase involved in cell wall biosynthesis